MHVRVDVRLLFHHLTHARLKSRLAGFIVSDWLLFVRKIHNRALELLTLVEQALQLCSQSKNNLLFEEGKSKTPRDHKLKVQGLVVQRLDNAIHRINCYPVDKY